MRITPLAVFFALFAATPAFGQTPGQARALCIDTFNVYFEPEAAAVPVSAAEILRLIAERIKKCPSGRILVTGHVDGFEIRFRPALGADRSAVVAATLLRQLPMGVRIIITDAGYTRPARKTALGIKEPLNRRVEIMLQ